MKSINLKNRFFLLVMIVFISMACVFTSTKNPPETELTAPVLSAVPTSTVFVLPTIIPTIEPTLAVTDTPTVLPPDQIIPDESRALYQEMISGLNQFEVKISQEPKITAKTALIGVEMAFANGNEGEALLEPQMMQYNIALLDRLQNMGVKGVVIAIKYPLLKKKFPHADDYLKFYQDIVRLCHQRKMKVLVEAGAVFSGTPYSSVQVDWSKETTASFLQGLQDQLVLISTDINPDYLSLANEPTTEEALTQLSIPTDLWQAFLEDTLKKVDHTHGTLYGAGAGTWENPEYIKAVFNVTGLDYIDLHIYPFSKDAIFLDRAVNYANQARAAGKKLVISECWLYKASAGELTTKALGNMEKVQNRDVFNYWTTLDTRYMKDIINLADSTQMDFVSFFWTRNLFFNLTYSPDTQSLTTQEYNRMMNQGAIRALSSDSLSNLGQAFKILASDPSRK